VSLNQKEDSVFKSMMYRFDKVSVIFFIFKLRKIS